MNTPATNSISVFCKTNTLSTKSFNNWFNGNTTNFGSKAVQPSFDTKVINLNEHRLIRPM
jgi:hypothetical protein